MPGCGYFSHFDVGSYMLFPNFVIKVDDTIDNHISFQSIGLNGSPTLNYAEPIVAPQNRQSSNGLMEHTIFLKIWRKLN
jgi:hypothetical protein